MERFYSLPLTILNFYCIGKRSIGKRASGWRSPVTVAKSAVFSLYSTAVSILLWPFQKVKGLLYWTAGWDEGHAGDSRRGSGNEDDLSGCSATSLVDARSMKRRGKREQIHKLKDEVSVMAGRLSAMEEQVREIDSSRYHLQGELRDTKKLVESTKSEAEKTRKDMKSLRQEVEMKFKAADLNLPLHTSQSKNSSTSSTPEGSGPPTPNTSRSVSVSQNSSKLQFTMKLTNFTRLQAANQPWYSPPFETSKDGHTMCLEVYPNGRSGRGTHLSVYTFIVKGKNDDQLQWPFVGHVVVELLNQLNDDNHVKMDFGEYTAPSPQVPDSVELANSIGMPQFLPLSDIRFKPKQKCQYLRNDILYFRVTVDVQNPKGSGSSQV